VRISARSPETSPRTSTPGGVVVVLMLIAPLSGDGDKRCTQRRRALPWSARRVRKRGSGGPGRAGTGA
jgi:hypothetical protein